MKAEERKHARRLRQQGWSLRAIANKLKCSKGNVSRWIRDISLTKAQIERLRSNQDRGRAKAADHPNSPKHTWAKIRGKTMKAAESEIPSYSSRYVMKILGTGLYWAEGYRAGQNVVNFSNSDPFMIKLMMKYFSEICGVPHSKFRGVVNIHPHLDREKAKKYWSRVSGIPLRQFHSVQIAVSRASQQKRDTLPLGTFRIVICDTRLLARIKGWIAGMQCWTNMGANSSAG